MTDTPKLGQLITDGDRRRDAIHIAVAPVTASERLMPGERIGLVEHGNTELVGSTATKRSFGNALRSLPARRSRNTTPTSFAAPAEPGGHSMNGMAKKKQRRDYARQYTEDGVPRDACSWTEEDWRSLHVHMEAVKREVAARHKQMKGKR